MNLLLIQHSSGTSHTLWDSRSPHTHSHVRTNVREYARLCVCVAGCRPKVFYEKKSTFILNISLVLCVTVPRLRVIKFC